MYSLMSRIVVAKILVQEQSVSELENFFQRKWSGIREDLERFFYELPDGAERLELLEEQLEKNNQRKYMEVCR